MHTMTPPSDSEDSVHEGMLRPGRWVRSRGRRVCSANFWSRRFPLISFLRGYTVSKFASDVIAGITVGLTFIPGVMAASAIAGLPPQFGLYASVAHYLVYAVLGSCKDITVGPTVVTALLCRPFVEKFGVEAAITITFYTGCVMSLVGLFKLGFLLEFISSPVLDGLLSATALSALTGQIPALTGIKKSGGHTFLQDCAHIIENLGSAKLWDSLLGLSCMVLLYLLKYVQKFSTSNKVETRKTSSKHKIVQGFFKYVSLGRNAIVVIVSTLIVANVTVDGVTPVGVAGEIEAGMPEFKPPPLTVVYQNKTLSIGETLVQLSPAASLPLISMVGSLVATKVFANGKTIDTTQEMIAVGVSNVAASFVQSCPGSAAVVRAVVGNSAGVQTPLGGVVAGVLVMLALRFFTNFLQFFPSATLAAIVITSVTPLVEIHIKQTLLLWRSNKADLLPLQTTFYTSLIFGLDYGMMVGIGVNLCLILYQAARPKISVKNISVGGRSVLLVTPDRSVTYPAAEHVKSAICKAAVRAGDGLLVVVSGHHVNHVDSTAVKVIETILQDLHRQKYRVYLWMWPRSVVNSYVKYHKTDPGCFRKDLTLEELVDYDASVESKGGEQNGLDLLSVSVPK